MFKDAISQTSLTTDDANYYFINSILGDRYNGLDDSFLSSLRALVYPRMKEGELVDLYFRNHYVYGTPAERSAASLAVSGLGIDITRNGTIVIGTLSGTNELVSEWMSAIKDTFENTFEGWHLLEKVTLFFHKQFQVLCFINPEQKSVYIITDSMDYRKMHYLQCGIFAFFPWYFDPNEGVNKDEMELIGSLREKTCDKYVECIFKIAEKYDFKTSRIRHLLSGIETYYERTKIANLKARIENAIKNINEYNAYIANNLRDKNDLENQLLGLQMKVENSSEESEIMEYFLCNDKLVLESVDGTKINFGVRDYLTYFNEDMAKTIIANNNSYMYRHRTDISDSDMEMLMTAIFVEQTVRINMCAAYQIDINGGAGAHARYTYSCKYANHLPNPHIDEYACLGGYSAKIYEFLDKHDYIGAIEQCIASCKSLNVGEAPTMGKFIERFYEGHGSAKRFIELPDGKVVSPKDAIEYLKQQQEGKDNG